MKIQGLQLSETGMQEGRLEVVSKPGSCDPNAFLPAFVIRTSELCGSRNLCLWVTLHPENQTLSAGNLVYIIWQDGWLTKELDIFVGSANNFLKKAIRHDCSPNNTQLLLEWELSAPLTNEKILCPSTCAEMSGFAWHSQKLCQMVINNNINLKEE